MKVVGVAAAVGVHVVIVVVAADVVVGHGCDDFGWRWGWEHRR